MKRIFLSAIGVAMAAMAFNAPLSADEGTEITTTKLAKSVSVLFGEGGNIGLSTGPDGVFMIDDQFAPLTPKILAAIKAISDEPVRFVLNTHWHFDHTGGNENLGKENVTIVAHDNVRKTMSIEQALTAFNKVIPAAPEVALPVITFNDTTTFHLNGETINVRHVPPAHTDGDSIVIFQESNIIHTGDVFFNGIYPFIDTEHGGSIDGMINAAEIVLGLAKDDTTIIPGHGPVATKNDLLQFHHMLVGVRDALVAAKKTGKSADEIVKMDPLKKYNDTWGKGFLNPENFIKIVLSGM